MPQDKQFLDSTGVSYLTKFIKDSYPDNDVLETVIDVIGDELEAKANSADLATVATTGDYNDLINKPAIDDTPVEDSPNLITSGGVYDIVDDIREIAEGKKNIYIIDLEHNSSFNSQASTITANNYITDIDNVDIPFSQMKIGDLVYVRDENVPDRWVSSFLDRTLIYDLVSGHTAQTGTPTATNPVPVVGDTYYDRNYTPYELHSIGNYTDTYENGEIYHAIGVYTFDGAESFDNSASSKLAGHRVFRNTSLFSLIPIVSETTPFYCTHFSTQQGNTYIVSNYLTRWATATGPSPQGMFCISEEVLGITSEATEGQAVAAFKAWLQAQNLAGTPVQVYFPLKTPTTEEVELYILGPRTGAEFSKMETAKAPIMSVSVNGTAVTPVNENINLTIPTDTSDLTNNAGYITSSALPTNYVTTDTNQNIDGEKNFVNIPTVNKEGNAVGKNLFNPKYANFTYWAGSYVGPSIYVGPNEWVTISYDGTLEEGLGFYFVISGLISQATGSNGTWMYHSQANYLIKNVATVQADENGYIYFKNAGTFDSLKTNILDKNFQVELGQVQTEYEPYISPVENLARISDIPINVSELINDSEYITLNDVPQELYECTYGTTTYSDISTAISNGKVPYCLYDGHEYIYSMVSGNVHYFTSLYFPYIYILRCHENSPYWSKLVSTAETTSNKVTSISNSSTDNQYPSAKCVYDNLQTIRETIEGKKNTYVVNIARNPGLNTQDNTVSINGALTDTEGTAIPLNDTQIGDTILITDFNLPDRWISNFIYGSNLFNVQNSRLAQVGTLQDDGGYFVPAAATIGIWTPANKIEFNGEENKQYKVSAYIKSTSTNTAINIALGFMYSDNSISMCGSRGNYTDYTYQEGLSSAEKTLIGIGVYYASGENIVIKDLEIRDPDVTSKTGLVLSKLETVKPNISSISVNGTNIAPVDENVNITIPTYESLTPSQDGTDLSLVTTGEKYNYVTLDGTQTISGTKTFSAQRLYISSEAHFTNGGSPTDYAYGYGVGIYGKDMMCNGLYVPALKYRTKAMYENGLSASQWNLPYLTSGSTYTLATTGDIPTSISSLTNDGDGTNAFITNVTAQITEAQVTNLTNDLQNIREIAEGKKQTYVVDITHNAEFNSQNNAIVISSPLIDIEGTTIPYADLSIGDTIYVTDENIPDRWVSDFQDRTLLSSAEGNSTQSTTPTPENPVAIESTIYYTNQYQPIELRGINEAKDTYSNGVITRNIQSVDLSTLAWSKNDSRQYFVTSISFKRPEGTSDIANLMCASYQNMVWNAMTNRNTGVGGNFAGQLLIYDARYINYTAEQFAAAMSGIILYYEAQTPTTENVLLYNVGSRTGIILNKLETAKIPISSFSINGNTILPVNENINIAVDTTPTNGSNNFITSNAVFNAVNNLQETINGKRNVYIVDASQQVAFNSQLNQISLIGASFIDTTNHQHQIADLQPGDTIYITQTNIPDRWVGAVSLYSSVPSLVGTSWTFKNNITSIVGNWTRINLNFTSNNQSFEQMIGYTDGGKVCLVYKQDSTSIEVYREGNGWIDENYRTVDITNGADVTNSSVITWLNNVATINSDIYCATLYTLETVSASVTDVQVNETSVIENGVANITVPTEPSDIGAAAASHTHTTSEITNFPTLGTVATSNNYNDLSNKPIVDVTPTENSTNLVSSGGVYNTIEDVREVAEGKKQTYVIDVYHNAEFDSENSSIIISNPLVDIEGATIPFANLAIGDSIYITDTDIPDRWVSGFQDRVLINTANGSSTQIGIPTPTEPINIVSTIYYDRNYQPVELRGIGEYYDTYENGVITRRIGKMILTGTEGWQSTGETYGCAVLASAYNVKTGTEVMSTHFAYNSGSPSQNQIGNVASAYNFRINANPSIVDASSGTAKTSSFKAWLAQEYANGTPVIVYFPLATETTENILLYELGERRGATLDILETAKVPVTSISVNSASVTPVNGNVNITVPTVTSDLINDSDFATISDIPQGVFKCTYGTTTYAEITQALNDGKLPYVTLTDGRTLLYYKLNGGQHQFAAAASTDPRVVYARVNSSNSWISGVYNFEQINNKVTELSSSSTDTQYPSAKCVYDNLTSVQASIPTVGTLNTTAEAAQATVASESLSNAITLHKVAKTGTYSDLIDTPTINTTPTAGAGLWDANTIINYIASRGQQLMTNGTFLLGNNYNFATGTFDGSDSNASGGCVIKAGAATSFKNDEFIPVVKGKTYRLTYDLKPNYDFTTNGPNSNGINGFLPYIDQYDIDKNMIADFNTNYKAGTLVQLTQDLVQGDTEMHLSDASAWTSFASNNAHLQIWDYVNSFGYAYGPGEYTRHTFMMGYGSSADMTTNVVTMQNAYSGPTVKAGTYVSQNRGGGYAYIGSYNKPAPNIWTTFTHDSTTNTIRGGCAYAKIGWLWNYNVSANQALTWDDQTAYNEGWAVKNNGIYYIAKKAVPAGTLLSNTEYWFTKNTSSIPIETKITNIQFTIKSLT